MGHRETQEKRSVENKSLAGSREVQQGGLILLFPKNVLWWQVLPQAISQISCILISFSGVHIDGMFAQHSRVHTFFLFFSFTKVFVM